MLKVGTDASTKGQCPKKEVDFVYTTVFKVGDNGNAWKFGKTAGVYMW